MGVEASEPVGYPQSSTRACPGLETLGLARGADRPQLGRGEQEPSGCGGDRDSLFKRWCWSNWMSTGEGMNLAKGPLCNLPGF